MTQGASSKTGSQQPAQLSRQSARPLTLWSWVRASRWVFARACCAEFSLSLLIRPFPKLHRKCCTALRNLLALQPLGLQTILGCNLLGCNLSGCNLLGCNLLGCNFLGCNLLGCNLLGCNLLGCNLLGCNLLGCNLKATLPFRLQPFRLQPFGLQPIWVAPFWVATFTGVLLIPANQFCCFGICFPDRGTVV